MKNKSFLVVACACALATGVFASEGTVPAYPNFGMPRVEEMMFLVLQIGVIIFAAKLGGLVASFVRLPSILGELAAGIVIGPWALGGIGLGDGIFRYGLFNGGALKILNGAANLAGGAAATLPMFGTTAGNHVMFDATSPALYGFATLASVILLFLSGLETNLKMFIRYSFVGLMVGVGGVVFSFVFGDLCAVYLLPKFFPQTFGYLATMPFAQAVMNAAPMYMGIMSTATSVGITARILSERKKMDSEEGVSIMAGAVIDDVLGLIVLAIGNGVIAATMAAAAKGGTASAGVNWAAIGMVAVKAFGVWLGATLIGVALARKVSWLLKLFKKPQAIATLAFGLSMILAGFFEYMGLAMIIGAYVTGLALSRTDLKHMIQETLQPVYTFLVPIFFCVMGMMVDCSALMSKPVLYFGLVYTVLAVAAKVIGCALPSLFCGFNVLGSLRIGAGMVPRGEVALIIAGLGLSNGFLSQEIFGIGILMTLVTTVIAPPVLVGLFLPKASGVRKPKPRAENARNLCFTLPDGQVAEIMSAKLVEEFHREGYFTIVLSDDPDLAIWQISKNAEELTVTRAGSTIRVECAPQEEIIVKQAWMEVVSQMNELAHIIARPVQDDVALGKLLADDDSDVLKSARMKRILRHFVMLPKFRASSKREAIEKLVTAVSEASGAHVRDAKALFPAVWTREESMPTGLDNGLAVPHGRTEAVDAIVGAVAIVDNSENPNGAIPDYETIDHSRLEVIVLTLAPEHEATPYLEFMAFISKALRGDDRSRLLACQSAAEMQKFFRQIGR